MFDEEKIAITLHVVQRLHDSGSWCAETNVQKTIYILESVGLSRLDYEFILYKHGPFSFDLRNDLAFMRSSKLLKLVMKAERYGPSIALDNNAQKIMVAYSGVIKSVSKVVDYVMDWVGSADIKKLEKLSTAVMVTRENPTSTAATRAALLNSIKPHISLKESEEAISVVDGRLLEAEQKFA